MSSKEGVHTYEDVADEYYIRVRHPTCANFGELSKLFIEPRLKGILDSQKKVLEVGVGKSVVAPLMVEGLFPLQNLIIEVVPVV